jgi:hypothetical protein
MQNPPIHPYNNLKEFGGPRMSQKRSMAWSRKGGWEGMLTMVYADFQERLGHL